MPTIRDIAQYCQVSAMTVSAVLNNRSGEFSAETRERVLKAVRELGYRPRSTGLRVPMTEPALRTVGVILMGDLATVARPGYFGAIYNGILVAAQKEKINVLLIHEEALREDSYQSIRTRLDGRCEGILLLSPVLGLPLIEALQERGFPFVIIGDSPEDESTPCVDTDSFGDAQHAVRYLIEQGHHRIGFIGGPPFIHTVRQRREGYRAALASAGIEPDPTIELVHTNDMADTYQFINRLASIPRNDREQLPTAFFCWNDTTARRTIHALQDANWSVPEDVSVIGYDDDPQSFYPPSLTTFRQAYQQQAEAALGVLRERIGNPQSPSRRIVIPGKFLVRDSTAPYRQDR